MRFKTEEEAIRIANDTTSGLFSLPSVIHNLIAWLKSYRKLHLENQHHHTLINDFLYAYVGLAAYLFTNSIQRSWRVSEALEYGLVGINEGVISTEVGLTLASCM